MTPAIETERLTKLFGDNHAVDGIDLVVGQGAIFGVLGPNGAGKTTMVRMLATLLKPDGGRARVLGYDVVRLLCHSVRAAARSAAVQTRNLVRVPGQVPHLRCTACALRRVRDDIFQD